MIWALPGLLLLTTGQDAGPGTPRSLGESLDEAQRLLGAREFEEARALLLAAVAEHAEDDQVLYRWSEIEDLLGEASFRAQYEPPEAANVVAGELLAWDPESGRVKIQYRRRARAPRTRGRAEVAACFLVKNSS